MNDLDLAAGVLHRGLGIVARWPGAILVIPSDPAHDQEAEQLVAGLGSEVQANELSFEIRSRLEDGRLRAAGLLLTATGGGLGLVFGPVEIVADGETALSGAAGLAEASVTAAERLTVRASNLKKAAEGVSPFDLRRGVAPGAGITLGQPVSVIVASPPVAPPRPDHRVSAEGPPTYDPPIEVEVPFIAELLHVADVPVQPAMALPIASAVPADAPPPVAPPVAQSIQSPQAPEQPAGQTGPFDADVEVMVHGIMCSRGHFNNPLAQFCQTCGISMVHVTHNLVPGPRPTLGFVVFDDGSTFGLNRSYIIGREPGETDDAHTAPLTIQDNNETLSRRHAELRLVEWTVQLIDLGSTNGSFIWDPAMEHWNQIAPQQAVNLTPGDTVALGRRTFVFESVTRL
ncbi:MAG: FHA domain-containing protein [Actinomycetota bacterium]